MNNFQLTNPRPRINAKLQDAALYLLLQGVILHGVIRKTNIAWRITPTTEHVDVTCQVSLLANGIWKDIGTFVVHEHTIDAIVEYLDIEINKALEEK